VTYEVTIHSPIASLSKPESRLGRTNLYALVEQKRMFCCEKKCEARDQQRQTEGHINYVDMKERAQRALQSQFLHFVLQPA